MKSNFLLSLSVVSLLTLAGLALGQGQPTTPAPPATQPVKSAGDFPAKPGETVITWEKQKIGVAIPNIEEKGVKFYLAWAPQKSAAVGRIMFFPHMYTDPERIGILNAMAVEQAIPLEAFLPMGASSVTLVLFGSPGVPVKVEAFDKDGKLVDSQAMEKAPQRTSPSDPQPSFEVTVKGAEIVYVRLSGPRDGEFLAAEQVRFVPLATPPVLPNRAAGQ
jgi:hypothetical protein